MIKVSQKVKCMVDGAMEIATVLDVNADGSAELVVHDPDGKIVRGVPGAKPAVTDAEKQLDGHYWL